MCVKIFAFFLLLLSSISFAAVIESIPDGGEWNEGYTWVGSEVPGPTDSVVIKGTVFVTASTSCGSLTIDEGAFLENGGTLGWVVLTVNGTITNNGTIKNNDSGNELWINADGDIINNGVWKCAKTGILSNKVQHISQASNTEFNGIIWKCNTSSYAADTFPLIASSDIVINVSDFDGKGSKAAEDFWGVFDLNNHSLTLKGATKLHKTELKNVKSLTGMDSSTIYSVNVYNPVELSGRITVTDANVTFYGDVTVKDTLQNGGTLGWLALTVNGTITNNGTIKNNDSGNELWINADGDIINNGVWKCAKTGILSNKIQHISQASNTEFNGIIWKCNTSSYTADTFPLIASSDIVINVSDFDGKGSKAGEDFWGVFDLNNHSLTLKGATKLHKTELKNVKSLTGMDSSTIYSVNVYNPVELSGRITVTDANVTFYGDVTVKDTLQNGGTLGWITLNVNKGIVNNGTVRDNPEGNELWLSIRGDVTNRAIWSNSKNTLLDSIDQTISIGVGKSITGPVFLDALWSEGPYQWCKDGVNLDGTGRTLTFDTLSASNLGIYQCKKNDILSRNITIKHADSVKVSRPGIEQAAFKSEIPFCWNFSSSMGNKLLIQTPVTRTYSLKLFAANGRLVSSYNGTVNRGSHSVPLEFKSSGTYLIRFESENILETRKITISK